MKQNKNNVQIKPHWYSVSYNGYRVSVVCASVVCMYKITTIILWIYKYN